MSAVVGEKAPDFTLPTDCPQNKVSLGGYTREGPVALIEFQLLAGFDKRAIEDYGVVQEDGYPERAYFIIDREGAIRVKRVAYWTKVKPEVEALLEGQERAL